MPDGVFEMKVKGTPLYPRFKLWISSDEARGVFGDGKWRLLAAIRTDGSLMAASRRLKMSYRKAWGDLRKAEDCLGVRFVERHRGGAGGGEAILTKTGKEWLEGYTSFRRDVERAVSEAFESYIEPLVRKDDST